MRNIYVFSSIAVTTILATACGANTASVPSAQNVQAGAAQRTRVANARSSYKVLYSFKGGTTDGAFPIGTILTVVGSELYGLTSAGGSFGNGTIFEIDPTTGAEHLIYSFQGGSDGADPRGGLHDEGVLYGTTLYGGGGSCNSGKGCGTVFSYTTSGGEKVIRPFTGSGNGKNPRAGLIQAQPNATLFGTAYGGGVDGLGTVYGFGPDGTERFLNGFKGPPNDGSHPLALMTADGYGTRYGTTLMGGSGSCSSGKGCGTVFELDTSADTHRIIYNFPGGANGEFPASQLIENGGLLYSVADGGGGSSNCGVFYSFDVSTGEETPLYAFKGGQDGCSMIGDLLEYEGFFYGTNLFGGGTNCSKSSGTGCGTIFKLTSSGTETVLYRFKGGKTDGSLPQTSLIEYNGNLYGTTVYGGSNGDGTVFEITP
jgi:uncharacterized repeat protein (TIGR03803 family)